MPAVVEIPRNVYKQKCVILITKTVNDKDQYLHNQIAVLPNDNLRTIKCTSERMLKTNVLPVAIKLFKIKLTHISRS